MREIANPKTNIQHLVNAVLRANNENMEVFNNGDVTNKGYIVVNNGTGYAVSIDENNEITSCTCPHHKFRNVVCKHMITVGLQKGLSLAGLPEATAKKQEHYLVSSVK